MVGLFGAALAFIGLGQMAIYFYPTGFGSPEWEFGAMAQVIASLPLPTMGFAAMLAAAIALSARKALVALSVLLALVGILAFVFLSVFWSVVPIAIQGSPELARGVIRQTVARTTLSGAGFGILYLIAAVVAGLRSRR